MRPGPERRRRLLGHARECRRAASLRELRWRRLSRRLVRLNLPERLRGLPASLPLHLSLALSHSLDVDRLSLARRRQAPRPHRRPARSRPHESRRLVRRSLPEQRENKSTQQVRPSFCRRGGRIVFTMSGNIGSYPRIKLNSCWIIRKPCRITAPLILSERSVPAVASFAVVLADMASCVGGIVAALNSERRVDARNIAFLVGE